MPGACCRSCGWLSLLLSLRRSPTQKTLAQTHTKVPLCNTLQIHQNLQHPSAAAFTAHPSIQSNYYIIYIYIHYMHPWHPSIRPWHPCKCPSIFPFIHLPAFLDSSDKEHEFFGTPKKTAKKGVHQQGAPDRYPGQSRPCQ